MHESITVFLEEINRSVAFLYEVIDCENGVALKFALFEILFSQSRCYVGEPFISDGIDSGWGIFFNEDAQLDSVFFVGTCDGGVDNRVKKAPESVELFYQGYVTVKDFRVVGVFF